MRCLSIVVDHPLGGIVDRVSRPCFLLAFPISKGSVRSIEKWLKKSSHLFNEREYIFHRTLECLLVNCMFTYRKVADNCTSKLSMTLRDEITNYHQANYYISHYPSLTTR